MSSEQPRLATLAIAFIAFLIGAIFIYLWSLSQPAQPTTGADAGQSAAAPDPERPSSRNPAPVTPSTPESAAPVAGLDAGSEAAPDAGTMDRAAQGGIDASPASADAASAPDTSSATGTEQDGLDDDAPRGVLSKETIKEAIGDIKPALKGCYEKTLEAFPEAEGKVIVRFSIVSAEGRGHVDMERIDEGSTLHESALHECLVEQVRGITFPSPQDGEVSVSYPFMFKGEKEADAGQ